jgi:hypothetical protein
MLWYERRNTASGEKLLVVGGSLTGFDDETETDWEETS